MQVLSFMRPDFKQHLRKKLEYLGDASMNAQRLDSAIAEYSAALSLDPPISQNLFIRRSKAYIARGLWKDALLSFSGNLIPREFYVKKHLLSLLDHCASTRCQTSTKTTPFDSDEATVQAPHHPVKKKSKSGNSKSRNTGASNCSELHVYSCDTKLQDMM